MCTHNEFLLVLLLISFWIYRRFISLSSKFSLSKALDQRKLPWARFVGVQPTHQGSSFNLTLVFIDFRSAHTHSVGKHVLELHEIFCASDKLQARVEDTHTYVCVSGVCVKRVGLPCTIKNKHQIWFEIFPQLVNCHHPLWKYEFCRKQKNTS